MLNILIPMAGYGSRFANAGYTLPKPLIPVFGRPMIEWVIGNLTPNRPHKFIFICQHSHLLTFNLQELLFRLAPSSVIMHTDKVTEGAACTALIAKNLIDNHEQLMIANCDQFIDQDINEYLDILEKANLDGLIMSMKSHDPKWSYVRLDKSDMVCEVAEKKVISNEATVGIYNYAHGEDFVSSALSMIGKNLRVNNEFYVAPTFNEMIKCGKKIATFNIGTDCDKMHGLGTPEDLSTFTTTPKNQFLFHELKAK